MDAKKLLIEAMVKEVASGDKNDKVMGMYQQFGTLLAMDISKAISPVNAATAPLTIAYLEKYAEELRKKFPDCIPLAEVFKKLDSILVEKDVK